MSSRRIGIVGYGHLGKYLTAAVMEREDLELAFVWNRSPNPEMEQNVPKEKILDQLENCANFKPDLIVEVAHPSITQKVSLKVLKPTLQFIQDSHIFRFSMESYFCQFATS